MWETVRWLRVGQVTGRLRRKLVPRFVSSCVDVTARKGGSAWQLPARRKPSFSGVGTPVFLNDQGNLSTADDWDRQSMPKLWRYNLHYFDDLNAEGAETRAALHRKIIGRWIDENPASKGTAWEPYPSSLRIVNWIKWALAGNGLLPKWQASLAIQADWVSKNIEWHLLGNHLLSNAKALIFAGLFFEGELARRWLKTGLGIVEHELTEQILSDGGQFERSPMYHALALEDVLDLINIATAFAGGVAESKLSTWREVAERMLVWEKTMKHPDGEIALFNDSAMSISPSPVELEQYACSMGVAGEIADSDLISLSDSGYVRAVNETAVLFVDIGEIGPDYLPGHAHADTLSFELSLFSRRWVVDTGCSTYEVSTERLRQRGTAAHNTVTIDGQDSSEVWSSFRVARRARPADVTVTSGSGGLHVSGSHDGYKRLKGVVQHKRSFDLETGKLQITDRIVGEFETAEANFLLHPDVGVAVSGTDISLTQGSHVVSLTFQGGEIELLNSTWHPEFGVSIATSRIRVRLTGRHLTTTLMWTP